MELTSLLYYIDDCNISQDNALGVPVLHKAIVHGYDPHLSIHMYYFSPDKFRYLHALINIKNMVVQMDSNSLFTLLKPVKLPKCTNAGHTGNNTSIICPSMSYFWVITAYLQAMDGYNLITVAHDTWNTIPVNIWHAVLAHLVMFTGMTSCLYIQYQRLWASWYKLNYI